MPEEFEPQLTGDQRSSFRAANEPGISWLLIVFFLILLALAVMMFGKNRPLAGPVATTTPEPSAIGLARVYTISYDAGVFSPTNLRIHAGDTVRFKNESIFPIHIMSEDMAGFDSVGDIPQGSAFSLTFAERGTFTYFNGHNTDQSGAIIVR